MASNGNSLSISQPAIPIFKGESYEFWIIKMKTLFKSQDLWDLVEIGFADPDEENRLRENKKRDSKALFFIQQAVHDIVFSRIATANTSKEAWTVLQTKFQGSSKVIAVKLQTPRHEFETLLMKGNESVHDFLCVQVLQTLAYLLYLLLLLMYLILVFSTVTGLSTKLVGLTQTLLGFGIGLHYYMTVLHKVVLHQPPKTSWRAHALYATCFLVICLFGRADGRKRLYIEEGGEEGKLS